MKNHFLYIFIIALSIISFNDAYSADNGQEIFFDAVAFKADSAELSRIDISAVVPYKTLKFETHKDKYYAQYSARIVVTDSNERVVKESKIPRNLSTESLFASQGGNGDFDYFFQSFTLPPGTYKVKLIISDEFSNAAYEKQRKISLFNFDKYDFSVSGTLLISKIEQTQTGYKITPYLSDNIAPVFNSLFTVMEVYNNKYADTVSFIYILFDKSNKEIYKSEIIRKFINLGKNTVYFNIKPLKGLKQGENYVLRTFALRNGCTADNYSNCIIAGSERSMEFKRQIGGANIENINLAIEQSIYAAYSKDMQYMRDGKTDDEKMERFMNFWKTFDPTPNTDRNEAYELYFRRVEAANQKFRSLRGDGWKSDMGGVLIVYGEPLTTERTNQDYMGRVYEKWTYSSGKNFYFLDNNGFGDYRLVNPPSIQEKFRFN